MAYPTPPACPSPGAGPCPSAALYPEGACLPYLPRHPCSGCPPYRCPVLASGPATSAPPGQPRSQPVSPASAPRQRQRNEQSLGLDSVPLGCALARCWLRLATQGLLRLSRIGVTEYARGFVELSHPKRTLCGRKGAGPPAPHLTDLRSQGDPAPGTWTCARMIHPVDSPFTRPPRSSRRPPCTACARRIRRGRVR